MQVHYNLLAGPAPDVSATQLRLAPGDGDLDAARDDAAAGAGRAALPPGPHPVPLCDRTTAVADVQKRFGEEVGQTANYLHLLCGQVQAGPVQTLRPHDQRPATIRAVAGHMHLLGRSIRIEVNPGTPPRADRAGHPGVGLRQPGGQARRAGRAAARATRSG